MAVTRTFKWSPCGDSDSAEAIIHLTRLDIFEQILTINKLDISDINGFMTAYCRLNNLVRTESLEKDVVRTMADVKRKRIMDEFYSKLAGPNHPYHYVNGETVNFHLNFRLSGHRVGDELEIPAHTMIDTIIPAYSDMKIVNIMVRFPNVVRPLTRHIYIRDLVKALNKFPNLERVRLEYIMGSYNMNIIVSAAHLFNLHGVIVQFATTIRGEERRPMEVDSDLYYELKRIHGNMKKE